MSKIKIFGMGGLNENGKNTYVVEIDNDIFVLDAGLKYANDSMFGIDYIIPDYGYLVKNKTRIKGVFITHAHPESYGAINDLLRTIPEIKVYATKYTKNQMIIDGVAENKIIEIKPHKKLNFGNNSVFPIQVNHAVPESVMYVINTIDGAICYTGDFIIDPSMMGSYHMDLGKIAYVGKQGVLALLCESSFSEKIGHTSPSHHLSSFFKEVINKNEGRIIFSTLHTHLYTIEAIFNVVKNTNRKIVIMGKKLQSVINMAIKDGYLNIPDHVIGDLSNVNDKNVVLLICDDRETPYLVIEKILNGNDKYIKLSDEDTVCFAESKYDENEKHFVKIENELAVQGIKTINIPKDKGISLHASSEDLMLMIALLKPKYFIPVKGEYRYMVGNANLADNLGYHKDNIILRLNGEVITINDKKLDQNVEKIFVDDILIDGTSTDDVGDLVIKDREMLSENGIVLISATLSKKTKEILIGPEVTTRGFIYVKDSKEMITEIKRISLEVLKDNITPNYVDFNNIKMEIRDKLSKYFYVETECKPMIIAVIQEV
ncbi:MAG: ribonuclease J [Bacilli bacterium]|nr:ribonuclease J [Bacilli bacterium]MDD3895849.1 ribonuclease J [Bacilli bacterium]MDD4407963.1 ribonuclease J [Bacilli bacterium]